MKTHQARVPRVRMLRKARRFRHRGSCRRTWNIRVKCWDAAAAKRAQDVKQQKPIKVTLPDGKVIDATAHLTTPLDIAKGLSNSLAEKVLVAKVNGVVQDLQRPFVEDAALVLLDFETKEGQHAFWHSSAHVLGQAIEKEFPEAKLCIGPPVEEGGFYYDVFMGERHVHPDDYKNLERTVTSVQKQKQPFVRLELTKEEALEMFAE